VIDSSEEEQEIGVVAESVPTTNAKSKKAPAKPRAKKTESAAAADAVESSSEVKAKKAPAKPRAKKNEVETVVASSTTTTTPSITEIIAASIESGASSQEYEDEIEEVEVEVIEFVHEGVQYLRGKIDNKIYDPETSEVVGIWNEETSKIDAYEEDE
jgi:BRCT domain type II-containing protein